VQPDRCHKLWKRVHQLLHDAACVVCIFERHPLLCLLRYKSVASVRFRVLSEALLCHTAARRFLCAHMCASALHFVSMPYA
jgi:hypothetical protein